MTVGTNEYSKYANQNYSTATVNGQEIKFYTKEAEKDYSAWQSVSSMHDQVNSGDLYLCTDGSDDGKISNKEKASVFVGGMVDKVKEQVSAIAKNPVKTLGIVGGVVGVAAVAGAIFGGPIVAAVLGVVGVVGAVAGVVKGVKSFSEASKQAENATTDHEAKQAYANMGGATTEIAENVVLGAVSAGQASSAFNAIKASNAAATAATTTDDALRLGAGNVDDGVALLDDGAKAGAQATDEAAQAGAKAGTQATDEAAQAGANAAGASTDDTIGLLDDGAKAGGQATDEAAQAGAQTVDEAAQEGAKAGAQTVDDAAKQQVMENLNATKTEASELLSQFRSNPTKSLYRKLASMVHPDKWGGYVDDGILSADDVKAMESMMQEVNQIWTTAKKAGKAA